MFADIEETLGRELHLIADAIQIPVMPPLPDTPPAARRRWRPMLAAALTANARASGSISSRRSRKGGIDRAIPLSRKYRS